MKLTVENVSHLMASCLFKEPQTFGETAEQYRQACIAKGKIVKGVIRSFCFDPERLARYRPEIIELLGQLPDQFQQAKGGGWSFLNACMDKDGNQWGEHRNMEELFCLGMGVDAVRELMPEMREALPGGMPYYVVITIGKTLDFEHRTTDES